jgi:hypothetical protein
MPERASKACARASADKGRLRAQSVVRFIASSHLRLSRVAAALPWRSRSKKAGAASFTARSIRRRMPVDLKTAERGTDRRAQPRHYAGHAPYFSASPMATGLVGTSGFAAIPTTALDLPLVQRLRRSPRFRVRVPKSIDIRIAASLGAGADEKGQHFALATPAIRHHGKTRR